MSTEVSPQKRVPLQYGDVPDEEERAGMDEVAWCELKGIIQKESVTYRDTGRLASPEVSPSKARGASDEAAAVDPNEVEAAAAKRYYLPFHSLYGALSEAGVGPTGHPGLVALHAAVEAESKMSVYWNTEQGDRKQRITARVRALEEEARAQTATMQKMLKDQRRAEPRPPGGRAELAAPEPDMAPDEDSLQQWRDQRRLEQLDDENAAAAHQEAKRQQQAAEALQDAKRKLQEQREQRHREREERLSKLKELEEDTIDTLEAASRVRGRWDKAKTEVMQTGDLAKIDDY